MSVGWGEKWPLHMKVGLVAAFVVLLLALRPDRTLNISVIGERKNALSSSSASGNGGTDEPSSEGANMPPIEKEPPMLSEELEKALHKATLKTVLTVRIYLRGIDIAALDRRLFAETGFDAAVYGDPNRFYSEIVPEIERTLEQQLGYDAAHTPISDNGSGNAEIGLTPIDISAIDAMADYLAARRNLTKLEQTALIAGFIADFFGDKPREQFRLIDDNLCILIVEADPNTVLEMAEDLRVRNMTLYAEPDLE